MIRIIKLLFLLLIIVIGLAIHLRNDQMVPFDFYLGVVELPFSLFLVTAVCLGALLGIVATLPTLIKLGVKKSRLTSQLRLSEKEIETLRVDLPPN